MLLKADLIDILENLSFEVIHHDELGKLIKFSPEDAFLFSAIVGANYLIEPTGVTMKGRSEVFVHRSLFQMDHYIYSPGLFERDIDGFLTEGNSSSYLLERYPEVFNGEKFLLIQEISLKQASNIEQDTYNRISKTDIKPENILLFKLKDSGSTLEPLYEYLASLEFIKRGYLIENQVPWFQQNYKYKNETIHGGIPDFAAFHSTLSCYLKKNGILAERGVHLSLLPVIKNFRKLKDTADVPNFKYELILGEVKSSKSSLPQAKKQLEKYSSVDLANQIFTIIPDVPNNGSDNVGEIYIDDKKVVVNEKARLNINQEAQKQDDKWLGVYIKILLLGNLSMSDVLDLISESRKNMKQEIRDRYEAHHLIDAVINMSDDMFFSKLTEKLKYGLH